MEQMTNPNKNIHENTKDKNREILIKEDREQMTGYFTLLYFINTWKRC